MKQLVQNIRTGESSVVDVPAPLCRRGEVLIQAAASLVSAGTERMVVEFSEKNLLDKARSRPDLVCQVVEKTRRDGILATFDAVRNRLDQPMALGYSVAGTVIGVGDGVSRFRVGDHVAAAGAGHAVHAEVVAVPQNLVVGISETVDFESAAFCTVGAVALHGMRLSEVRLGETVAVIGLGLIGQITVQLVRAAGCRVIGIDLQAGRAALALTHGAEGAATEDHEFESLCLAATDGRGVDAVLITADTESSGPVNLAARVAREKGIVVAVGAVGTDLQRRPFYDKELEFRLSRSYGPGRYDPQYEEQGIDYPYGYVRWTLNRNMSAFAQLLSERRVSVGSLVTHRFSIEDANGAYELITGKTKEAFLGVVLVYLQRASAAVPRTELADAPLGEKSPVRVGLVGAGSFAKATLLPAIAGSGGAELVGVAAASGLSAQHTATRYHFRFCSTDAAEIIHDASVNTVVIATRHDLHAPLTLQALRAGKHVFVEKPLCLSEQELCEIERTYSTLSPRPLLMVGLNRRFAPFSLRLKDAVSSGEPLLIQYRINAGFLPPSHWTQKDDEGGGRIVGEAIHFIDWTIWLTGSHPTSVYAKAAANAGRYNDDNVAMTISFADGSVAEIVYLANGDRALGKERIEVHSGGRSAVMEDFRRLEIFTRGRRQVQRSRLKADKGHAAAWSAFRDAIRSGRPSPVPWPDIVAGMRCAFAATASIRSGEVVALWSPPA